MELDFLKATGEAIAVIFSSAIAYTQTLAARRARREVHDTKVKAEENIASAAVSLQHKATADLMEKEANSWRERYAMNDKAWEERYAKQHAQLEEQTKYWHGKSEKDQATLSKCQEECTTLKARTDLAPLMDFLRAQETAASARNQVEDQILKMIDNVSRALERIHQRLDLIEPDANKEGA